MEWLGEQKQEIKMSAVAYTADKKYHEELKSFKAHVDESILKFLDILDKDCNADEMFDVTLVMCGKAVTLQLNADVASDLERLLATQIKDTEVL